MIYFNKEFFYLNAKKKKKKKIFFNFINLIFILLIYYVFKIIQDHILLIHWHPLIPKKKKK